MREYQYVKGLVAVCPACFFICFLAVAVCAAYFALGYFGLHALQREASARRLTDIEVLVASVVVVKLQHDRIALAAVHAVMHLQVVQQPRPDASAHRGSVLSGTRLYFILVGLIVPLLRQPLFKRVSACHGQRE